MADNVTRSIDDARLAAKDAGFDPDSRHSEDSNGCLLYTSDAADDQSTV